MTIPNTIENGSKLCPSCVTKSPYKYRDIEGTIEKKKGSRTFPPRTFSLSPISSSVNLGDNTTTKEWSPLYGDYDVMKYRIMRPHTHHPNTQEVMKSIDFQWDPDQPRPQNKNLATPLCMSRKVLQNPKDRSNQRCQRSNEIIRTPQVISRSDPTVEVWSNTSIRLVLMSGA